MEREIINHVGMFIILIFSCDEQMLFLCQDQSEAIRGVKDKVTCIMYNNHTMFTYLKANAWDEESLGIYF